MTDKGVPMRLRIMPGLIAGTSFHSRKDMYQAGIITPLLYNSLNAVLFAKLLDFANKLYLDSILRSQALRIFMGLIIKGLCPLGIIKKRHMQGIEESRHPLGKTPTRYSSPDNDPVIAGQNALYLFLILFGNQCFASVHSQGYPLLYNDTDEVITNFLVLACPGYDFRLMLKFSLLFSN